MSIWQLCRRLALVGMLLMVSAVPQAAAQEQSVQPSQGVPGMTFRFFATGFGRNAEVVFWLNTPAGDVVGDNGYVTTTNRDGRADWQWISPGNAQPGIWQMVAQQRNEPQRIHTIPFEILPVENGSTPPEQPETSVEQNVEPRVSTAGAEFEFFATGFKRKEVVGYWFNAPDGQVYSDAVDYRVRVSDDGRADWAWTAPLDVPTGIWQAVARGEESGIQRTIFFEIVPLEQVTNPSDTNQPDRGAEPRVSEQDDTVAFFATGFAPGEEVSFWAISPSGREYGRDSYTVDANDDGRADWFWRSSRHAETGEWQMVALGQDSNITKSILFEIVAAPEDDDD